jgi:aminoglycoside phosphotransferase (APT) family kinase protein
VPSDVTALRDATRAVLAEIFDTEVTIERFEALAGGASQEAWALDATILEPDGPQTQVLVLRRDLGGAFTTLALSREAEYEVLVAASEAGVRAPRPLAFVDDIAGQPALFMQRLPGEAVGRKIVADPAFERARSGLVEELARELAAIHAIDVDATGLRDRIMHPAPGIAPSTSELDRLTAELDALGEPHPAIELGLRWLRLHEPAPPVDCTFVHGDYRIGNVLLTEGGLEAVLDWEFAHVGDPAEDIGWLCVRAWRFGADALRLGGIGDRATFLAAYERASGRFVDPQRVNWWEVFGNVKWAIGALGQAHRHLDGVRESVELAAIGRICAEMEYEILHLIDAPL